MREHLDEGGFTTQGVNHIDSSAMHALHQLVHDLKHNRPGLEIAFAAAKRNCRRRILREIKVVNYGSRYAV